CSSILWIVAFTGPNSTTCGQIFAMKRPSEVPPVVDSCVDKPVSSRMALDKASLKDPTGVRKGSPPSVHGKSYSSPCLSSTACTRCFSDSGVDSVEKRKLKSITSSPGITLVAPVPPWMFDTCQLVGGK